jgi:HAMP domain-containing protein
VVTSQGPGRPGSPYPLAPELVAPLRRAFERGQATFTDVYQNQSGTWVTAFAPLYAPDGRVVAVLDVDYPVGVYLAELTAVRQRVVLHALIGATVALVAGVALARRITRPVEALADAGRRVVEGELGARARVQTRDEIGLLGHVVNLLAERVEVSHRALIDAVVGLLETRGDGPGSLGRLRAAAGLLGGRLGLGPVQRDALELGALLHDIGELRIPEAVLSKAGPLSPEEWATVRTHPQAGVELLRTVPLLAPALDVVRAHHERYDGRGYPQGLAGEAIPLPARVFAVVDALDAMTRPRPHRLARSLDDALTVLKAASGTWFDPGVVEEALAIPPPEWAAALGLPPP